MLNIASKVHAILLNRRLRDLADAVVPETQVGFRPEHGAADGVGIVRRVLECFRMTKTTNQTPELNAGVYALFVDLAKAFDSVDRELLWQLLGNKCGVPSNIVAAIRNLRDGMQARTFHRGQLGQSFGFNTGVRQGSIEGPTLWNIFYCFVLFDWKDVAARVLERNTVSRSSTPWMECCDHPTGTLHQRRLIAQS